MTQITSAANSSSQSHLKGDTISIMELAENGHHHPNMTSWKGMLPIHIELNARRPA
jgi:hypothetical protein